MMNQGMLSNLLDQAMKGSLQGHPLMNLFNQMMHGKSRSEQIDTLLNAAQSKGIDINAKQFTEDQVRRFGLRR